MLSDVLEAHSVGCSGAMLGQQRFPLLLQALSNAGELFPDTERGLPGQLGYVRSRPSVCEPTGIPNPAVSRPQGGAHGRSVSSVSYAGLHEVNGKSPSVQGLDYLDWCKVAQIWLLQLCGDRKRLEAVCWQPGLWGQPSGRQLQDCALGRAVGEYVADVLQDSNEVRASGLILQIIGYPEKALDVWMSEYDSQCSQIGLRKGNLHSARVSPLPSACSCINGAFFGPAVNAKLSSLQLQ